MKRLLIITAMVIVLILFLSGCESKDDKYDKCMQNVYNAYVLDWDGYCRERGLKDDCSLPATIGQRLEKQKQDYEDRCLAIRLN